MSTQKTLRVRIDPDRCVGYGRCATIAQGLYLIDAETGKAYFEEEALASAAPKDVFAGARACPTQAIQVEQFGRRVYPQILSPMPADIARALNEDTDGES